MISIKIEGEQNLKRVLTQYGKAVGKEAEEVIEDIAVSGARYLANNTNPFGLSGKTKEALYKAVYKDVLKVYVQSTKPTQEDDGSYMEQFRNRNGRIPKNIDKPMFISPTNMQEIMRVKTANVGNAKEGWFDAIKNLKNQKRIPAWLKKPIDLGSANKKGDGIKTEIALTNSCKYINKLISPAEVQKSLGLAYKNYINFINRKMDALAKKV